MMLTALERPPAKNGRTQVIALPKNLEIITNWAGKPRAIM
jgi:hypothetical protein